MDQKFDQRRLDEAIKYSALDLDIKVWKDGVKHAIGQDGTDISGGQRSRIAFARCLYRNSDIYILDDIVSALDSGVASFVMKETIGKYLQGKTVLLCTHNLTVLPYSNHIIFMEEGKIAQQGDFASFSENILWKKHNEIFDDNKKQIEEAKEAKLGGLKPIERQQSLVEIPEPSLLRRTSSLENAINS